MGERSNIDGNGLAPPPYLEALSASGPASSQATPVLCAHFACVTLTRSDRLQFCGFPEVDLAVLGNVIVQAWPRGIDSFGPHGRSQEVKLNDHPWRSSNRKLGYDDARRLVLRLLECLYNRGWVLQAAVDVSRDAEDRDTFFFRYQSPPPPLSEWLVISFDWGDRLKIAGSPTPDVAEAIVQCFGPAVDKHQLTSSYLEIKFHGYPWAADGTQTLKTRFMVLRLLETLETCGFTLYTSVDHTNSRSATDRDAEIMIVHRPLDWVPGMPVWRRS